jgi:hypothetical protein
VLKRLTGDKLYQLAKLRVWQANLCGLFRKTTCGLSFNSQLKKALYFAGFSATQKVGWGGRDRTSVWRNQNPLPYRLATPQSAAPYSRGNLPPQQLAQGFSDDYKLGSSVGV